MSGPHCTEKVGSLVSVSAVQHVAHVKLRLLEITQEETREAMFTSIQSHIVTVCLVLGRQW